MSLTFDHSMQFPSDLIELINSQATQSESQTDQSDQSDQTGVDSEQKKHDDALNFLTIELLDGETKLVKQNLKSWVVKDLSSSQIDIEFTLEDLLSVSQEDSTDILAITICAQEYNTTDGDPMPGCLHKLEFIPRQLPYESDDHTLSKILDAVSLGFETTLVTVAIVSLATNGSLGFLWGLINTH